MQIRITTEPQQGASYDDLLAVARTAEECGFDAFFRSDHRAAFGRMGGPPMGGRATGGGEGLPGSTDAWLTLAALARETTRIRLGTLVTPVTFRLPGPLAIGVAQIDVMSGGRVELGLGTGWFDAEHRAYGIPFPALRERFDMLEEQLAIITGLWSTPLGESFSFGGKHYQLTESPALPKPVQRPRPPIVIGGTGTRRTPRLAAMYADDFNAGYLPANRAAEQFARVRAQCEAIGRDPTSLVYSTAHAICYARDTATLRRRAAAIGVHLETFRHRGCCGNADEVIERLALDAAGGAQRTYLQVLDPSDLDHIREIAEDVLPAARGLA